MAILPKGGINVAGHKIPWEAIAALAGVAGVILVIRSRQQGSTVGVGQAPAASAIDPSLLGFGSQGFTPDYSGSLANIEQQLTTLGQTGINATPATPPAAPAFSAAGSVPIPVYSYDKGHQGILGYLQPGQAFTPTGQGFGFANNEPGYLVNYGGVQGFVEGSQTALGGSAPI